MDNDTVIKVDGVYKRFCRSLRRSLAYGTYDLGRNLVGLNSYNGRLRKGEFWSLEDINFEVKKGETFGLVGANGSGKTTLLRLINGIFPPDRGKITIKGRIGALIAVGAGFHPHMTGRENIFLNGTILGMTKEEIKNKYDDIINFADIGEFLDAPVSTYSSGMYVRLGFAIAIHSNPDIVLVDEILAVGDAKFQRKCLDKIREMRKRGTTFLIVSHNMQNIISMCNRCLLLDHGKQVGCSIPKDIVPKYELLLQSESIPVEPIKEHETSSEDLKNVFKYPDFGTNEVDVERIYLINQSKKITKDFKSEDNITLKIEVTSKKLLENVIVSCTIVYINDINSEESNLTPIGCNLDIKEIKKGRSEILIDFGKTNLTTGLYKVAVHFFDATFTNPYSQGMYGYFKIEKNEATMSNAGRGTPLCWTDANITIYSQETK